MAAMQQQLQQIKLQLAKEEKAKAQVTTHSISRVVCI
jgi:hypothetical protein